MKLPFLFFILLFIRCALQPGFAQSLSLRDSVTYWDNIGNFHKASEVSLRWQTKAAKENGTESIEYADALYQVALFQYELGGLDEALKTAGQLLELRRRLYKKPVVEIAKTQNLHGIIYKFKSKNEEAKRWYLEAEKTLEAAGEQNNSFYGTVLNNIGTCYYARGQYEEALIFYTRSLEVFKKGGG